MSEGEAAVAIGTPSRAATTTAVATAVGIAAATHWVKKAATPRRPRANFNRSMATAEANVSAMMSGPAPMSRATAAASTALAPVTTHRR